MREIKLTDDEILSLNGKVNPDAQHLVDRVKQFRKHLSSGSIIYAEIITEAENQGKLEFTHRPLNHCVSCDKRSEYPVYKSGRNKGRPNTNKSKLSFFGITFMDGFITVANYSKWGFCTECGQKAKVSILQYIREHNLPIEIPGDSKWIRENQKKCYKCNELIWEFDMGLDRTLMGDGYYHSTCPYCGARTTFFGPIHSSTNNYRVVESQNLEKKANCWQRISR